MKQGRKSGGRESVCFLASPLRTRVCSPLSLSLSTSLLSIQTVQRVDSLFSTCSQFSHFPSLPLWQGMGWVAISCQLFPLRECLCGTNCTWTLTTIFLAFFLSTSLSKNEIMMTRSIIKLRHSLICSATEPFLTVLSIPKIKPSNFNLYSKSFPLNRIEALKR